MGRQVSNFMQTARMESVIISGLSVAASFHRQDPKLTRREKFFAPLAFGG
jgi:hypothetical protein